MDHTEATPTFNDVTNVLHPHDRQILVSFGNRHVVFGSRTNLPDQRQLGPDDVKNRRPRVGDEREGVETRIVESLVIDGFEVQLVEDLSFGDVKIIDRNGRSALVEIKVGDRSFAGIDLAQAWSELAPSAEAGERREIWAFNVERLSLGIVWSEGKFSPSFEQLPALDVWEFNQDGTVFDRRKVLDELDEWARRVEALYTEVEAWAQKDGLTTTRNRTVPMSEELMQSFAVPDRDIPILDVADRSRPIVSMVPAGLGLGGFAGLIHIITRAGSFRLGALPKMSGPRSWVLINPRDKEQREWNSEAFKSLLGLVPAYE